MNQVGEASAATLGYIVGDIPGAIAARNLYRNYRNSMPPVRSQKRRPAFNPYVTPQSNRNFQTINPFYSPSVVMSRASSRRGSVASSRLARARKLSSVGTGGSKASGTSSVNSVTVRKRGNKVHKEGLKKKVKVSREFRKKVKAVIDPKGGFGSYTDISYTSLLPIDIGQNIAELGYVSNSRQSFFSPATVLGQASVLFAGTTNAQTWTSSTLPFSHRTFKCTVVNQSVTVRMKNNTARDLKVNIYAGSPRGKQYGDGFGMLGYWDNCLLNDYDAGSANRVAWSQTTAGAITGVTSSMLGISPKFSKKFMQNYTLDTTTVTIEPGKEYVYVLQGPQNKEYDFAKFWSQSGQFDNQQKFIKQILVTVAVDVTSTTVGQVGRYTDMTAGTGAGLMMEVTQKCKMVVPEQAGLQFTAAPGVGFMPLNRRMPVKFYHNWAAAQTAATNVVEYEDENPLAPATGVGV